MLEIQHSLQAGPLYLPAALLLRSDEALLVTDFAPTLKAEI